MSTGTTNTPRLLAAAKEFNIGKETLIDYLTSKGFEIDAKPSTKLTEDMYNALQKEYAKDKAVKRKSEEIALPKGSLMDQLNKSPEDLDISAKDKKQEKPIVREAKTSAPTAPKQDVVTPTPKVEKTIEEEPAKVVPAPVAEVKKEEPKEVVKPIAIKEEVAPVAPVVKDMPKQDVKAPDVKPQAEEVKLSLIHI